jgi:hypothetical protein
VAVVEEHIINQLDQVAQVVVAVVHNQVMELLVLQTQVVAAVEQELIQMEEMVVPV